MNTIKCSWKDAKDYEKKQFESISLVFRDYPELVYFILDRRKPRLRNGAEALKEKALNFPVGQEVLVHVALDIWNATGNTYVWDLFETLNDSEFNNVISALKNLGCKHKDGRLFSSRQWELEFAF